MTQILKIPVADDAGEMSDTDIARMLALKPMIEGWLKAIRDEAMARLNSGKQIPGWAMAPGRRSRDWKSEEDAIKAMGLIGINDPYEHKLKTVPALEKNLSDEDKATIADYWQWHAGTPQLKQTAAAAADYLMDGMSEVLNDPTPKTPDW